MTNNLRFSLLSFLFSTIGVSTAAQAAHHVHVTFGPADCEESEMMVWDYSMGMCAGRAMAGMPMSMLMVHGNSFFMQTEEEKPRGRDGFSVPNEIMVDWGKSLGDRNYFDVDFMGTVERWTFPPNGTPEFLQIGDKDSNGTPYLDAQHPHSSPVMGLTFSDTISFGSGKDYVKVWFAPRGQSTDGPVPFMHRPTGLVNPDVPLGHHIGQDVGHISSTVIGASLRLDESTLEVSTFHGAEAYPMAVDLPMGTPDSFAARFIQQITAHFYAMGSAAYVKNPDPDDPTLQSLTRYSASAYGDIKVGGEWTLHEALIWGLINNFDHASALNSFAEEYWLHKESHNFWGRLEVLQRTPNELQITGLPDSDAGRWVTALTVGYTHTMAHWDTTTMGLGGSITKDFLPAEYQNAYSGNPLSARVFLQVSGSEMWEL